MDKIIEIKNISKRFDETVAIDNISLDISRGDFITLLGPSGCGKTTTLRVLAGFEYPDEGEVLMNGKDLLNIDAHDRPINTVFQRYALFPHMNVEKNIAFGLKLYKEEVEYTDSKGNKKTKKKKLSKEYINKKVNEMLKLVDLEGYNLRSVNTLSGGQMQRVAIARALINEPRILLLDEPLGALDLKKRQEMQIELKNIHKELGITFIYVTHDQEEALSMSDRIIVMNNGKIIQAGTPKSIYDEPVNKFVANFIGDSNIIEGIMIKDYIVKILGQEIECIDKGFCDNEPVDVVIRPEDIELNGKGHFEGIITDVSFLGVFYELRIDVKGYEFLVQTTKIYNQGDSVTMNVAPEIIHVMKKT